MRISAGSVGHDEGSIVLEAENEDDVGQLFVLARQNVATDVRYDGPDKVRRLELHIYNPQKFKLVPIVSSH